MASVHGPKGIGLVHCTTLLRNTRMHSSRMHTGILPAAVAICWGGVSASAHRPGPGDPPGVDLQTPLGVGLEPPPRVWAWRHPARPLNLTPGCEPGAPPRQTPQLPPGCGPGYAPPARPVNLPPVVGM